VTAPKAECPLSPSTQWLKSSRLPSAATELDVSGPFPAARIEGGERVEARCVLIATGADHNKLDVPECERFEGLGMYYAATHTELASCRGPEVVVGGGNAAG
jgi:thioredoxin reductase (NADPH)